MKALTLVLAFCGLASIAVHASPKQNEEMHTEWKNKPDEKFSDAEKNFGTVKKMLLEKYYDAHLSEDRLYEAATQGMLQALNPNEKEDWNKLFTPAEYKEFRVGLSGEIVGVGVVLRFDEDTGYAPVLDVVPHSIAEKAGIKAGDQIVSANGKLFKGLQLQDLVYEVRGKAGETVRLKILRGDEILSKNLTRERVEWSAVESTELEHQVAWIKIHYFIEKTPTLLKEALEKAKQNHSKAIILDLRDNEGGLFDQAVESASLFTPNGKVIVKAESRGGQVKDFPSSQDPLVKDIPVVLLVNSNTSSGAELFSGSLSENLGAKIVGEKTHGKWSAQTLEELPNGFAVKFTTSIFKTPSGKNYSGKGLEPDLAVNASKDWARTIGGSDKKGIFSKDEVLRTAYQLLAPNRT